MNNRKFIIRELVNLKDLREQQKKENIKKKKKKKTGDRPFINKNNKILLPTREDLKLMVRESNRTKLLIEAEFTP